jgi:chromate transporter
MLRRWSGAIVTLLASSIPCTLFVVVITMLFDQWQENAFAQAAIKGAVAAAVAVTVKTVWTIAHPYFKTGKRLRVILIGASAFLLNVVVGVSPIYVLLIAAVVGCFLP